MKLQLLLLLVLVRFSLQEKSLVYYEVYSDQDFNNNLTFLIKSNQLIDRISCLSLCSINSTCTAVSFEEKLGLNCKIYSYYAGKNQTKLSLGTNLYFKKGKRFCLPPPS